VEVNELVRLCGQAVSLGSKCDWDGLAPQDVQYLLPVQTTAPHGVAATTRQLTEFTKIVDRDRLDEIKRLEDRSRIKTSPAPMLHYAMHPFGFLWFVLWHNTRANWLPGLFGDHEKQILLSILTSNGWSDGNSNAAASSGDDSILSMICRAWVPSKPDLFRTFIGKYAAAGQHLLPGGWPLSLPPAILFGSGTMGDATPAADLALEVATSTPFLPDRCLVAQRYLNDLRAQQERIRNAIASSAEISSELTPEPSCVPMPGEAVETQAAANWRGKYLAWYRYYRLDWQHWRADRLRNCKYVLTRQLVSRADLASSSSFSPSTFAPAVIENVMDATVVPAMAKLINVVTTALTQPQQRFRSRCILLSGSPGVGKTNVVLQSVTHSIQTAVHPNRLSRWLIVCCASV
jgi:hypothetical protein